MHPDTIEKYKAFIGKNELFDILLKNSNTTAKKGITSKKKFPSKKVSTKSSKNANNSKSKNNNKIESSDSGTDDTPFTYTTTPNFITGTLRDYQIEGVNWLICMHTLSINCVLADEMGLGKTLQTITFLGYLKENSTKKKLTLLIVPKSTLNNWKNEFAKFYPTYKVLIFHCAKVESDSFIKKKVLRNTRQRYDVIVTTYEMCINTKILSKINFNYIIIDEAHRIKNENSKLSMFVRMYSCEHRMLITGTPLQNNVRELWALLNFLVPDVFSDGEVFEEWIKGSNKEIEKLEEINERDRKSRITKKKSKQINKNDNNDNEIEDDKEDSKEQEEDSKVVEIEDKKVLNEGSKRRKIIIDDDSQEEIKDLKILNNDKGEETNNINEENNDKEDNLVENNDKEDTNIIDENNESIIDNTTIVNNDSICEKLTVDENDNLVSKINDDNNKIDNTKIEDAESMDKNIQLLRRVIMPFFLRREKSEVEVALLPKKIVNLYPELTEMQRLWYRLILKKEIKNEVSIQDKSALMNIVCQLRKVCNHPYLFEGAEPEPFTTDEHLLFNSGKMIILDKLLKRCINNKSRVLIFSQMSRMLDILEDYCLYREYTYRRLDGSTSSDDRSIGIDEFNSRSDIFIYLLTTRAGGLGINLTGADTVIIYDCDWNPQMDLQAMDRAHRIGQKKQVYVYRFIMNNTIEEKIIERCMHKLKLDECLMKKKQEKLDKGELLNIISTGINNLENNKDIKNNLNDIEEILRCGEERTELLNKKVNGVNFGEHNALDLYKWEGQDYRQRVKKLEEFVEMNNQINPNNVFGGRKKSNVIYDFQFYPRRYKKLKEKDVDYILDDEEVEEMEKLKLTGFDWSRREFNLYLKACENRGKNIDNIIEYLKENRLLDKENFIINDSIKNDSKLNDNTKINDTSKKDFKFTDTSKNDIKFNDISKSDIKLNIIKNENNAVIIDTDNKVNINNIKDTVILNNTKNDNKITNENDNKNGIHKYLVKNESNNIKKSNKNSILNYMNKVNEDNKEVNSLIMNSSNLNTNNISNPNNISKNNNLDCSAVNQCSINDTDDESNDIICISNIKNDSNINSSMNEIDINTKHEVNINKDTKLNNKINDTKLNNTSNINDFELNNNIDDSILNNTKPTDINNIEPNKTIDSKSEEANTVLNNDNTNKRYVQQGFTESEVRRYHQIFWDRKYEIMDIEKYLNLIEKNEVKRQKNHKTTDILKDIFGNKKEKNEVKKILNNEDNIWSLFEKFKIPYTPNARSKVFTESADRLLLFLFYYYMDHEDVMEKIRQNLRFIEWLKFDWYIRARNAVELGKRIQVLTTLLLRQEEKIKHHEATREERDGKKVIN